MHTDNLRKLARETNDGVLRGPAFVAADEIDRLRAEIERLRKALSVTDAKRQINLHLGVDPKCEICRGTGSEDWS